MRTGASIAVTLRERNPLLAAELTSLAMHGLGIAFGNVVHATARFLVRF